MIKFLIFSLMFFLYLIFFIYDNINNKNIKWDVVNSFIFFVDSNVSMLLIFMMMFIYGMVMISENNKNLLILSSMLIFICLFFFVSSNMMMLYVFFEMSMFPILVMILGFGQQIEKVNSA